MADRDLFIIGPDGTDILGRPSLRQRRPSPRILQSRGHGRPRAAARRAPPPGNFRPQRAAPQIVGADGATYTVLLVPRRPSIFGALSLPGISLTILVHRAGGERPRELVAGAAFERADPPHPGGRAGARHARDLDVRGRARASKAARTSSPCWRATSTRWPISCAPTAARSPSCCATSRTSCARRSRACASPSGLARQPTADLARQLDRLELRDRAARRADQPDAEARAPARHRRAVGARAVRAR